MRIKLHTTSGNITLELDEDKAPKTAANFVAYVREGFYDGTVFHRVIDGFMIQGGGFEPGMVHKSAKPPIENEADNGLKNDKGTVAMARTNDPHSACAQFFINCNDNDSLNFKSPTQDGWGYCVFARVVEGIDAVTEIEESPTRSLSGHQDVPREDIVIEHAEVLGD